MGPSGDDDEDGKKNIELRKYVTDLYDMIRDAQEKNDLPRLIRREVYIEWCELVGVDVPHSVLQQLEAFEEKQKAFELEISRTAEPAEPTNDDLPADGQHLPNKKRRAPQTRLEANQTKIILALLLKARLTKQDTVVLSRDLSVILKEKAKRKGE
jgi:hypothetical protein